MDVDDILVPLKRFNPLRVILFGSFAYGIPSADSDIDLLVVVDTKKKFHQRIQEIRSVLPKDRAVDLIVLTPKEYQVAKRVNPLVKEISFKGRNIYG